jgi:hypothetical protein
MAAQRAIHSGGFGFKRLIRFVMIFKSGLAANLLWIPLKWNERQELAGNGFVVAPPVVEPL